MIALVAAGVAPPSHAWNAAQETEASSSPHASVASAESLALQQATPQRLTSSAPASNGNAHVARDGRIAFVSDRSGAWQVWVMDSAGRDARQLTNGRGVLGFASWSPDGRRVYFHRTVAGVFRLFSVDVATATESAIPFPERPGERVHRMRPSVHRDGTILYDRRVEGSDEKRFAIAMARLDGSNERILVPPDAYNSDARRSPDGQWLVWQAGTGDSLYTLRYELYRMRVDGRSRQRLTAIPGLSAKYPRWSPDGRHIVFSTESHTDPTDREVHVMCANGSAATRLTTRKGIDFDPTFTADGRAIVYTSDAFGGRELVRLPIDQPRCTGTSAPSRRAD